MIRAVALFALTAALVGCASPDFMTRGEKTPESLPGPTGDTGLQELWSVALGSGNRYADQPLVPAVADGRVYVADWTGDVMAVEADSGRRLWRADLDAAISAGPTVGGGVVVVGTRDAQVFGLSAKDGTVLWKSGVTSEVLAPAAHARGTFVVRAADGRVFALNAQDGSRRWLYDRTVPVLTLRGNSRPLIDDGRVLIGLDNGKLVALALNSGEEIWETTVGIPRGRTDLERMVDLDGRLAISRGTVYAAAYQGRTAAVDIASGDIGWARDIPSHEGASEDVGNLYITDDSNRVWALDRFNGASVWRQDRLSDLILTAPVTYGGYVVVASNDGYLNWLSRDSGALEARTRLEPLKDSERFASIRANAMEDYVFVPPDWTAHAPEVADGRLYVWSLKGHLTAFELRQ
ncbi:outer membrane protein assembly factor BamB [Ectothiorhodospiraceae bacterium WFHF3C12]|nr:outer membrane protein assembly factor BamB [Ectothiorhodospiraceae bacterium WFHF3C12]